ncbi:unnamed protein product [Effrenium voratum]|nr:unnamed protein product [Effrenium voratum]
MVFQTAARVSAAHQGDQEIPVASCVAAAARLRRPTAAAGCGGAGRSAERLREAARLGPGAAAAQLRPCPTWWRAARASARQRSAGNGRRPPSCCAYAAASCVLWREAVWLVAKPKSEVAITACQRCSQWQEALSLRRTSVLAYNSCIAAAQQGHQWPAAWWLLKQIWQVSLEPTAASVTAISGRYGAWRSAAKMLDLEVSLNTVAFNSILSCCADATLPSLSVELLRSMRKRSLAANVISYNIAIRACEKSGAWQLALHLLTEMTRSQLLPDLVSVNSAISACDAAANWQLALRLLHSARGLQPDAISLGAAVSAAAGAKQWRAALGLLVGQVPNLITSNSAASGLESGQWQLALRILELETPDLVTFNCVLRSLGQHWRMSLRLLQQMQQADMADLVSFNAAALSCERFSQSRRLRHMLQHVAQSLQSVLQWGAEPYGGGTSRIPFIWLDNLALAPEFSFFGMMAKQVALEHQSFGVFLADSDEEVSEISFGGFSPDQLTSPLSWAPVASPELGYWQVQMKSVRIGNRTLDYCNDGQCRAVVDTGTSLLAVPEDFADQLQQDAELACWA